MMAEFRLRHYCLKPEIMKNIWSNIGFESNFLEQQISGSLPFWAMLKAEHEIAPYNIIIRYEAN